jgi:acyl-[acyl carrier protein]--UDP-N-acetylglucosamine O-acyltransferase
MGAELRGVHALHAGDPIGEIALLGGMEPVFKDVIPFGEIVNEEMGGCIKR